MKKPEPLLIRARCGAAPGWLTSAQARGLATRGDDGASGGWILLTRRRQHGLQPGFVHGAAQGFKTRSLLEVEHMG